MSRSPCVGRPFPAPAPFFVALSDKISLKPYLASPALRFYFRRRSIHLLSIAHKELGARRILQNLSAAHPNREKSWKHERVGSSEPKQGPVLHSWDYMWMFILKANPCCILLLLGDLWREFSAEVWKSLSKQPLSGVITMCFQNWRANCYFKARKYYLIYSTDVKSKNFFVTSFKKILILIFFLKKKNKINSKVKI